MLDVPADSASAHHSCQVDRGTDAMQNILSTVLFSITPQLVDVLIGSTYLAQALEPTIAVIMFVTVASYM